MPVLLQPSYMFHDAVWKQPRIFLVPVGQSHGADCRSLCSRVCIPYIVFSRDGKPSHPIGRYSVESRSLSRCWQLLTHIHIDNYNGLVSLVTMHAILYVYWLRLWSWSYVLGKQIVCLHIYLSPNSNDVLLIILQISRSQYVYK